MPLPRSSVLQQDGQVDYYPNFLLRSEADQLMSSLRKCIPWEHDRVRMFGKELTTKRQVSWHAVEPLSYSYAGTQKTPNSWNADLETLNTRLSLQFGTTFNSCLLNLYSTGSESMGWHADNEKEHNPQAAIASISLGAERRFLFKHKRTGLIKEVILGHGSLLLMHPPAQEHWLHRLPPMLKVKEARINLTFRSFRLQA